MALLKKAPDHRKAIDSLVHMVTDSDIDTPYEDVAARDVYLCERDLDGGSTWSAGQMRHGATHIWLFNEGIFLLTPMMEFVCFQQQAYCLEELAYVHHGIRIDPATVQNIGVRTELVRRDNLTREIRTVGRIDYDERRVAYINTKI
ncbi:MAG: hypothetical protein ACE5DM_04480, partial [Candidatus Nanoarchaeia archaeon]